MDGEKSIESSPLSASSASILKELKKTLRDTPSNEQEENILQIISQCYTQIHIDCIQKHPAIFPLALTLCSELFPRSSVFRKQITSQMNHFVTKFIDAATNSKKTKKPSKRTCSPTVQLGHATFEAQSLNIQLVLSMLEHWKDLFQANYPILQAACHTLEQKGYVFPNVEKKQKQAKKKQKQQEEKQKCLVLIQYKQFQKEKKKIYQDIQEQLKEMQQLFDILVPKIEEYQDKRVVVVEEKDVVVQEEEEEEEEEEEIEWEDVVVQEEEEEEEEEEETKQEEFMNMDEIVEAYGLGSASYELTVTIPTKIIEKTKDNAILFKTLMDGILRLKKRYIPLVHNWIQILTEMKTIVGEDTNTYQLERHEVQVFNQQIEEILSKWNDLIKEEEEEINQNIIPSIVSVPVENKTKQKVLK